MWRRVLHEASTEREPCETEYDGQGKQSTRAFIARYLYAAIYYPCVTYLITSSRAFSGFRLDQQECIWHLGVFMIYLHIQTRHSRDIPLNHLLTRLHLREQLRIPNNPRRILHLAARLI